MRGENWIFEFFPDENLELSCPSRYSKLLGQIIKKAMEYFFYHIKHLSANNFEVYFLKDYHDFLKLWFPQNFCYRFLN